MKVSFRTMAILLSLPLAVALTTGCTKDKKPKATDKGPEVKSTVVTRPQSRQPSSPGSSGVGGTQGGMTPQQLALTNQDIPIIEQPPIEFGDPSPEDRDTLRTIYFDFDKSNIKPEYQTVLETLNRRCRGMSRSRRARDASRPQSAPGTTRGNSMSRSAANAASASDRLARNPRVADQVLSGEAVVLDYEGRRIVGLNPTGTVIWNRLDGASSLGEIARSLALETGAPKGTVEADVLAFADSLLARGLVVDSARTNEGQGRPAAAEERS